MLRVSYVIFLLHLVFVSYVSGQGSNKLALLIGISKYQNKEWHYTTTNQERILSADNDVAQLKKLLMERGFPEQNITTLLDDDATKNGIENAIDNLIKKSNSGTNIYFHFSGHGQQIYDKAPLLDELDGFDEAIVPTDAPMHFDESLISNEKHIRDDYLNMKISELRKKIGSKGSVLVVLDACHSGSGTRGNDEIKSISRGSATAYMPRDYQPNFTENWNSESFEKFDNDKSLAPMVCFYACGPGELNYEVNGKNIGSLTYAFIDGINQCDSNSNYRTLFEYIQNVMKSVAPNQRPQYEGDLNGNIFNGQIKNCNKYFRVNTFVRANKCEIKAGSLQGIGRGTKFAFFRPEADTSKETPIATGLSDQIQLNSSIIILDSGIKVNPEIIEKSWAYPVKTELPFSLTVNIKATNLPGFRDYVLSNGFISLNETNAYLTTYYNRKKDSVIFENKYGYVVGSVYLKETDSLQPRIRKLLLKSAKAEFFRNLEQINNLKLKARLNLYPYGCKMEVRSQNGKEVKVAVIGDSLPVETIYDASGNMLIKEKTFLKLSIESLCPSKNFSLFYSILDIQPDDVINVITNTERLKKQPDEFVLEGNDQVAYFPKAVKISPPYGNENFVLITAAEPIDFSGILGFRGVSSSFSSIFNELESGEVFSKTRGYQFGINDINIHILNFKITE